MATVAKHSTHDSISSLLIRISRGDREAENLLIPQIYEELRRIARSYMRKERPNHTLQPTALVNQAYVRLMGTDRIACENRAHFLALAARAMRHVLADHAEARNAERRGGGQCRVTLDDVVAATTDRQVDEVVLNQLLNRLAKLDERQARVVELKVFGGLSFDEIAYVIGTSSRSAKRDWAMARAWLYQQLSRPV
jgi:RNA polymerase sigma-70 factor, ECF subfamily